jgi:hypothetical protein
LDEAERRAYRIADNKLTELGEWDEAMLRDEIAGLLGEDFDLALLGMTDEDLDAMLRDPDEAAVKVRSRVRTMCPNLRSRRCRWRAISGNWVPTG